MEPVPEAQLDCSNVRTCQKAFQELKNVSPQVWTIHNDMGYDQLVSDPSTYVEKRSQRPDDSILLRHMDDVVDTGPDTHLSIYCEHMNTSLYLTDVVVLRNEGDTVNFWGL